MPLASVDAPLPLRSSVLIANHPKAQPHSPESKVKVIKIYVLEDNDSLRRVLCAALDFVPDMEVCGAANCAEAALQHLPSVPCDVVLVDLNLPGMNGIEFIRRASAQSSAKFIALTSHRSPRLAEMVHAVGGSGYLVKEGPETVFRGIREAIRESGGADREPSPCSPESES